MLLRCFVFLLGLAVVTASAAERPPNILFAIADDWGAHASAYGTKWVQTPHFDRVAREGILFTRAFTPNAKCAPSRACILTGRNSWQLEAAANHICYFPPKFKGWGEALAENGWFVGDKKVVRETVKIEARPTQGAGRVFTVTLTLQALGEPVTLSGSHEKGKSYGGFSARFAPREQTKIQTANGEIATDEDLNPHAWAEMTALYNGRQATLRITPDGAPLQWCLRHYGFVGASFPGRDAQRQSHTLQPGQPLQLRFTVTLSD